MQKFIEQKIKEKDNQQNLGFTLVESLVAISIFTIAVLTLLSVLSGGLVDINYAKRKITAEYLAQEGIEFVRNLRDTNVLFHDQGATEGWNRFKDIVMSKCDVPVGSSSSKACYIDVFSGIITACNEPGSDKCPNLRYYEFSDTDAPVVRSRYQYSIGEDSGFKRTIKMEKTNADQVKIYSNVSWKQGSGTYQVTNSETLFSSIE